MENKDKPRFATAIAVMGECFQKEPSESMSEMYWRVLQDMPIDTFESACMTLVNTRKITGTFPLVAEIREAATGGAVVMEMRTAIAWDKLMYAIATQAPYNSVDFDDPIIFHIVRSWGGWDKMGDWPEDENHWRRKEFVKLYAAYAANPALPEPDGHLVGLTEAHNRDKAPEFVPQPFLISGTTGNFKATQRQEPVQITHEPRCQEAINQKKPDQKEDEGGAQVLQGQPHALAGSVVISKEMISGARPPG